MHRHIALVFACLPLLGILLGCGQETAPWSEVPPATATPIPGWEKFEANGIAIWLPESYEGGSLGEGDVDVLTQKVRGLGPEFEQIAQMVEQNPSAYVLWMFDSVVGNPYFLTNVSISKERILSAITIDSYLDVTLKQLPSQIQVLERSIIPLGNRQAGRLIVGMALPNYTAREIMYIVKEGNTMWLIAFATSAEEFDERQPTFEQSAHTFTIQP